MKIFWQIQPGAQVFVEHWGGDKDLEGRVRIVEPSGFLKISALGVEEQRVNVLADFTSPFEQRTTLGDGYRIEARIVVAAAENVVKVPVGTLFRAGGSWHVFCVVNSRAAAQPVEMGLSNGRETEIAEGVSLILYPTDEIHDGSRIRDSGRSAYRPTQTASATWPMLSTWALARDDTLPKNVR